MSDILHKQLAGLLKEAHYSLTGPRRAVFEQLALASEPLSMKQLTERVGKKVDRTSVYRTVELYEKLGVIERLQIGWKYKLELSARFSHHHHHATCVQCGNVTNFEENAAFESGLHEIARRIDFELHGHVLELRGVCNLCQEKSKSSTGS